MRVLVVLIVTSILSCATNNRAIKDKRVVSYSIDKKFSSKTIGTIREAFLHFEKSVGCVSFKEVIGVASLRVKKIPLPGLGKGGQRYLGFFIRKKNIIELTEETLSTNGVVLSTEQKTLFKVVLHELAHWAGMVKTHRFPIEVSETSQLTRGISTKSEMKLYAKDIVYLKSILCK